MQELIEYRLSLDTTTEAGQKQVLDLAEKVIDFFCLAEAPEPPEKVTLFSAMVEQVEGDLIVKIPGLTWDCDIDKRMKLALILGFLFHPKIAERTMTLTKLSETFIYSYGGVDVNVYPQWGGALLKALGNCLNFELIFVGIKENFLIDSGKKPPASPVMKPRTNAWMDSPFKPLAAAAVL